MQRRGSIDSTIIIDHTAIEGLLKGSRGQGKSYSILGCSTVDSFGRYPSSSSKFFYVRATNQITEVQRSARHTRLPESDALQ